jgi:hypothetical protein
MLATALLVLTAPAAPPAPPPPKPPFLVVLPREPRIETPRRPTYRPVH